MANDFHQKLKIIMNEYVHLVYRVSQNFPRGELFGTTSQIRRAALSVILNYIEGYARQRSKVYKNFLEISYASLKETKYLTHFCLTEKYLNNADYKKLAELSDEIGAMLWATIKKQ
ncbi:MAG: four helix bundle protein [Patescibacteria group bacterium]|jgi:four helix bundle protein